jgi:hypothetical protein
VETPSRQRLLNGSLVVTALTIVPKFTAFPPGACILHADIHPMTSECWGATLGWYLEHDHLKESDARAAYQAAVERKMLDLIARQHRVPDTAVAPADQRSITA